MAKPAPTAPKLTPMMEQFHAAKREHPDAVLFFRMGDFYELFLDDAVRVAPLLGLTLTSRDKGPNAMPMAGVPVKSVTGYLKKLVALGERVAICEQVEDPRHTKGIVKREVVRVLTAGTLTEEDQLAAEAPNYCAAIAPPAQRDGAVGLAWADVSTGEFVCTDVPLDRLADRLAQIDPAELLLPAGLDTDAPELAQRIAPAIRGAMTPQPPFVFGVETAERTLHDHFGTATLAGFGCPAGSAGVRAAGAVLRYFGETQKTALTHIRRLRYDTGTERMALDRSTQRALELTETLRAGERDGSLLAVIDHTKTAPGARRLRAWLLAPLIEAPAIRRRQAGVAVLVRERTRRDTLRSALADAHDLERLAARVAVGRASPRDCDAIGRTLGALPAVQAVLAACDAPICAALASDCAPLPALAAQLQSALESPAPITMNDGAIFRDGWNAELDALRTTAREGGEAVARFQQHEVERTGIATLKVGYNAVHGYYLEVPKGQVAKVPEHYKRRQTLKNVERYVTPELHEFERTVLGAEEKSKDLERDLFLALRDTVAAELATLQARADAMADADVLQSLAEVAARHDWVAPAITDDRVLAIDGGRHPVVERILGRDAFVPNDCRLGAGGDGGDGETGNIAAARCVILTGPNMAGKSTYIRQVALQVLLAQLGGFVPARKATVGVVDRVFARVGSADDLSHGASTFMVEMTESANILNSATNRSLVILDEIGRGTSTFDGVSIAWAMAEHLHDTLQARTLFATHYHEMTALAESRSGVSNRHVAVADDGDRVVFLHQIREGTSDRSYGVHVAQLAGVPAEVVARATELLQQLESGDAADGSTAMRATLAGRGRRRTTHPDQIDLFAAPGTPPAAAPADPDPVRAAIAALDVENLTPMQAMQKLAELRDQARR